MANYTNLGVGPGPQKRSSPPPPFGRKPALDVAVVVGGKKPMGGMADHEAAEPPEMEASEESGASLLSAIDAICDRQTASKLFAALADALTGQGDDEPPAADLGDGAGMEGAE